MARKIDEDFAKAPSSWVLAEKLWTVSGDAYRAWSMMTTYAAGQHTDGYVSTFNARRQCSLTEEQEKELIEVGLMDKVDGGFVVHSHDGTPWATWQYTSTEREEDRQNGAKGGQARATKSGKSNATVEVLPSASEVWPGAKAAFEKCWEAYKAPNRGSDREAAYRAFCDKVPDQAASDLFLNRVHLLNGEITATYSGFKFVNFLDVYKDFTPRPKAPAASAQTGSFKVTESQNSDYYGETGAQEI